MSETKLPVQRLVCKGFGGFDRGTVIEAVQWDGCAHTANVFIGEQYETDWWYDRRGSQDIWVNCQGEPVMANVGDYITRGEEGLGVFFARDIERYYEPDNQGV